MDFLEKSEIKQECLRMLTEFITVCNNFKLNWFIDSGSLLGCIRDEKMIPWDDDIDIIMPRDDYNKLLSIGKVVFPYDIFFQTPETDDYFCLSARLRSNIGTCLTKKEHASSHHKGIFIDIFPLDAYPGKEEADCIRGMLRMFDKYSTIENAECKAEIFKVMNDVLTDMSNRHSNSEYVADIIFCRYTKYIDTKITRNAYSNYFIKNFEQIPVRVPIGYEEILECWYGKDWRIPQKESTFHNAIYIKSSNVRKSYTDEEYEALKYDIIK